ncbi:carbonic anhydrase [Kineosporia babensis]|uniref:Carbonic anhydrase n=1 Tax=Kineosporia babensis TaxID=499548 RepID=A0A9X1NDE0_9ACTN|nr:carbonic anhydrase [Kineosporia babensis]MCD5311196.1 carbonic anhydrase [Kineosporia babensis]
MSTRTATSKPAQVKAKSLPGQRKAQAVPVSFTSDRAAQAWAKLQQGNARWVNGQSRAGQSRNQQRRADLVAGQQPFAAILSCADSRTPPEIVFDQGLGDVFVVRTAGHAVDDAVLGSLEYAIAALGVDLVLVLGHEKCGAIKAAHQTLADGTVPGGYIRDVVSKLTCDMATGQNSGLVDLEELTQWHADSTAQLLQSRSGILRDAVAGNTLGVLAATYELSSGLVHPVRANLTNPA